MDTLKKEAIGYIKGMKTVSFKNKHGEKFNIHSNGVNVFMSGDEVDAMVEPGKTLGGYIPLFNEAFSIWSAEELAELGQALVDLHNPAHIKRFNFTRLNDDER